MFEHEAAETDHNHELNVDRNSSKAMQHSQVLDILQRFDCLFFIFFLYLTSCLYYVYDIIITIINVNRTLTVPGAQ